MQTHALERRDCVGNAKAEGDAPHLGTLTNLLKNLMQRDARPDPANPPVADANTERPNWGSYPLLIDRGPATTGAAA